MTLETLTTCPICDAPIPPNAPKYATCPACRVCFARQRMDDATVEEYYRGEYRKICPVDDHDIRRQKNRAWAQLAHMGDLWRGSSMLEIGCSAGKLMEIFAARGYRVVGVDPDRRVSQYAHLADVPPEPFDMICLSHVLEHANHPRRLLETLVRDYSHAGTRVMIDVPNCAVVQIHRPHHPFEFMPGTLARLVEMVGMIGVRQITYGSNNYILGLYEVRDAI